MKRTVTPAPRSSFTVMAANVVYKQVPAWYGHDNRPLHLNILRKPGDAPKPLVVWVGGGAWQKVSQNAFVPEMVYLTDAGYTVATVEYRSSEDTIFPAQIEDVKAAIRYLRAHADRWHIDPSHVAIMGESAGGHLAAMAGVTGNTRIFDVEENLEQSSAVQCAIDWYGPTDFTVYSDLEPANSPRALLIGCQPKDNPEKARAASPIAYASKDAAPFLIIHGTDDQTVPFAQSESFYDALIRCGAEADLVAVQGALHGDPVFGGPEIRGIILEFLEKHMK